MNIFSDGRRRNISANSEDAWLVGKAWQWLVLRAGTTASQAATDAIVFKARLYGLDDEVLGFCALMELIQDAVNDDK